MVTALGGDQFQADVARRYLDSAGQAYDFVLPQRYRNAAPGQWARLPPDTSALLAATTFYSQNITVRFILRFTFTGGGFYKERTSRTRMDQKFHYVIFHSVYSYRYWQTSSVAPRMYHHSARPDRTSIF